MNARAELALCRIGPMKKVFKVLLLVAVVGLIAKLVIDNA